MQTITVQVDEEVLQLVELYAIQHSTTVSKLLQHYLEDLSQTVEPWSARDEVSSPTHSVESAVDTAATFRILETDQSFQSKQSKESMNQSTEMPLFEPELSADKVSEKMAELFNLILNKDKS